MRVRRRVRARGRVQGVWFRAATREQAADLGVAGWVANRADGTVEAVFEGSREAVDALVAWSREGPELAVVEELAVFEEEPEGLSGFGVR